MIARMRIYMAGAVVKRAQRMATKNQIKRCRPFQSIHRKTIEQAVAACAL